MTIDVLGSNFPFAHQTAESNRRWKTVGGSKEAMEVLRRLHLDPLYSAELTLSEFGRAFITNMAEYMLNEIELREKITKHLSQQ